MCGRHVKELLCTKNYSISLFFFPPVSSKNLTQERKATPTPREMTTTKSPLSTLPDQQTLFPGLGPEMYRHISLAFDPSALGRSIPIDSGTVSIIHVAPILIREQFNHLHSICVII